MSKSKNSKKNLKAVKRTVKYIAVAPDTEVARAVIRKAPNAVIQAVSNAALNTLRGDVHVPPHLKPLFRRHIKGFEYLIDRSNSLDAKRRLLSQEGGAFPAVLIPLIGTALGALGIELISRVFNRGSNDK